MNTNQTPIARAAEKVAGHISNPHTLDEIGTRILSGDYSAELMLQHLLLHAAGMVPANETPQCSTHPDAPHGFDRGGSHSANRYVCDCEGWVPPDAPTTVSWYEGYAPQDDPPSDAPTPETSEAAFGTGRVSVDFARRLEREKDEALARERIHLEELAEARAELAKLKNTPSVLLNFGPYNPPGKRETDERPTEGSATLCDSCDWTFGCFDGSEPCQKKPKTPEGSAVEWVKSVSRGINAAVKARGFDGKWDTVVSEDDALELARRCDEEEQQVKRYDEYHSKLIIENESLRAQLAAAQARADLEADNARQSREEIEALKGDVAKAQAKAAIYKRQWEIIDRLIPSYIRDRDAAQAEARELREALRFIQWNGGGHTDEGVSCNGTWCAEQARAALAKEGQR